MAAGNAHEAMLRTIREEGGYVDHPKDPGGATKYGVTIPAARVLGLDKDGDGDVDKHDIIHLTVEDAVSVYRRNYWNRLQADFLPSGVDIVAYDYGINSGTSRPAKAMQKIVGGLKVDGVIGPLSLAAIHDWCDAHSGDEMVNAICDERLAFMQRARHRVTQELLWPTFGGGWEKRVARIRKEGLALATNGPKALTLADREKQDAIDAAMRTLARVLARMKQE